MNNVIKIFAAVTGVVLFISICSSQSDNTEIRSESNITYEMSMVLNGQCPSSLKRAISKHLKDPSSFRCEDIGGSLVADTTEKDTFVMGMIRFSGTNSFNARVSNVVGFTISKDEITIGEIQ